MDARSNAILICSTKAGMALRASSSTRSSTVMVVGPSSSVVSMSCRLSGVTPEARASSALRIRLLMLMFTNRHSRAEQIGANHYVTLVFEFLPFQLKLALLLFEL